MYDKHIITKKEHYSYFSKQSRNQNFFGWLILYESKKIGFVRILDYDVSIFIEKKFQGKGIGARALKLVEKEAKKLGIKKLIGRIMIDNKNSESIFKKNGFRLKMLWFEKNIEKKK